MRTFVAIELPKELREQIGMFGGELGKLFPLRLVAPQNLHLTLFFLGEVDKENISKVIEAVKAGAKEIKPFYLFLDEPEFFPKKGRIHGAWLKLSGQLDVLNKLYQQISQELEKRDFLLDRRLFSAHITIGRAKGRIKRIKSITGIRGITGKFKADSVSVFTSILKPEGPIYSKIETIPLE